MKTKLIIALLLVPDFIVSQSKEEIFILGKELYNQGKYDAAISSFEELVDLHDNNSDYYYWLGISNIAALETANFFEKATYSYAAKENLQTAIQLNPAHENARFRLANYYIQAPAIAGGSYTKAMEQATALKEYNIDLAIEVEASIYLHQEEYDMAEKLYLDLIKKNKNNKKVYYKLSTISLGRGDYTQALNYCKKSIKYYPEYKMGYYQFGKVSSLGEIEQSAGIENLYKYISFDLPSSLPDKKWAYFRLGKIFESRQEVERATNAYKKSIQLDKSFSKAKDALAKLEDD